ncbi:MAG: hypothetical protein QGH42_08610 [Kiritimatiellia bacterium]|jgi:hypothetical protein|nr:hypothetical protein [Kiritimatiellia bacterium]MDP6630437.1 hypothetical protein [Kiritimatiellia bacterium]MDP6809894.1 hypothetical protein [Kiritimatiellia bacterium]MDP7024286.1 hypothetical protein [Kiritimatiellia bacterium]
MSRIRFDRIGFPLALLVGLAAAGLPYGFLIGLVGGTLLDRLGRRLHLDSSPHPLPFHQVRSMIHEHN